MAAQETLLITQADVRKALDIAQAVAAVEDAFRAYGEGRAQMPAKPYLHFDKGDLRSMPGYLPDLGLAAVKNVNVHPQNAGLPTVMGTVTVFDPETGFALAIMDGTYLTAMRTGAAGGVAARYLARPDAAVASFIGAGRQAAAQLAALMTTMPAIVRVLACDLDACRAEQFAQGAAETYGVEASACALREAVRRADVLTTVTPARKPFVMRADVQPGTHINAIGADAPGKQELEVAVLTAARVVVDSWDQASHGGEINVAVRQGAITRESIYGDIGEVVSGRKPGRKDDEQITVFDSTGLAIQDVACAAHVYRRLTADPEAAAGLRRVDLLGG
ncbi:MAG: hypothetical protein AMK73_04270 [Planctomycetes bacterium SM23_32]|nr:MAG: hypothetical protein AMK73_04270 [Planctomycetes bacterium SM23_32]